MSLDSTGRSTNPRVLARWPAEAFVVIVSILVAFSLDAWWSERQSAREVREDLKVVGDELARNAELIESQIDQMQRIVAASGTVGGLLVASSGDQSIEAADTLIYWVVSVNPTLDVSLGGLDALLASGRLQAIGDAELRIRLAGLRDRIGDAVEEQLVARDVALSRLAPHLGERFDYAQLDDVVAFTNGRMEERLAGGPMIGKRSVRFPNDLAIRNTIRSRAAWYRPSISEMLGVVDEIEAIRELIRAQVTK